MDRGTQRTRAPLFVRLPAPLLSRLDDRIVVDGRTKQAVVEDLLAAQLAASPDERAPDERSDAGEILDLAGVAAFLRVSEAEVLTRITSGDFPARRLGDQWRCSRSAVLAWLSGTDAVTPRAPGFASS